MSGAAPRKRGAGLRSLRVSSGGLVQRRTVRGLRTRHVDLRARGSSLGVRIVLAADIHARDDWFPRPCVEALVDQVNRVPETTCVALVGDFVGGPGGAGAIAWSAPEYGRINAPTFAVLGNHDHWADAACITRALTEAGVEVLTNRACPMPGRQAWVAGLDSAWSGRRSRCRPDPTAAFGSIPAGSDVVVLGHEPHLAMLHEHTLHLAGHTHCGQIRSPVLGDWTARLHMPRFSEPYPCRLSVVPRVDGGERWVYTTAGVGYSTADLRVLCPPEIVVIDA